MTSGEPTDVEIAGVAGMLEWRRSMVYGFGQLLSEDVYLQGTIYEQSDQVGSPNLITSPPGALINHTKNLPYGERLLLATPNQPQSLRRFTNHEDQDGSAIYMQARTYLPAYGKFAQVDPAYDQTKDDPESWNLYNYVTNNPVTHTDPDGRTWVEASANALSNWATALAGESWDPDAGFGTGQDMDASALKMAEMGQCSDPKPVPGDQVGAISGGQTPQQGKAPSSDTTSKVQALLGAGNGKGNPTNPNDPNNPNMPNNPKKGAQTILNGTRLEFNGKEWIPVTTVEVVDKDPGAKRSSAWNRFSQHFENRWSAPGRYLATFGVPEKAISWARGLTLTGAARGIWAAREFELKWGIKSLNTSADGLATIFDFSEASGVEGKLLQAEECSGVVGLGWLTIQVGYAASSAAGALGDTIGD